MKEKQPLDSSDKKKLGRRILPLLFFGLLAAAVFGFIALTVEEAFSRSGDTTSTFMMYGFGVFFFGVIGFMVWSNVADIRNGQKYRVTGVITNKRLNIHKSAKSANNRTSSQNRTTRHHYITVNEEEYLINAKCYQKARVGSQVVYEYGPLSKVILRFDLVEESLGNEEKQQKQSAEKNFLELAVPDAPFTEKDEKAVKRLFRKQLKARLIWLVPTLFIVLSLVYSNMEGLLLFLFPIVIVPPVQLFKIVKSYKRFRNNMLLKRKKGKTVIVEDKTTFTSNQSKTILRLITSMGQIAVSPEIYDSIAVNDHVLIFYTPCGKQVLSIVTMNKQEFFVN